MSFFLVFLAVVLVAAVLWAGVGRRSRRTGGAALPALLDSGFDEPPANLPPVLLPERAEPEDVTRLRFSLGLRGYRMDQVDQVLDELKDQLAARDAELAELRDQLAALAEPPGDSSGDSSGRGPARAGSTALEGPGADAGAEEAGHPGTHEGAVHGKGGL